MPGRFFVTLWLITFAVQAVGLQMRLAVFGGRGWLSSVHFITAGERLGFLLVLLVFSAAAAGAWLSAALGVARLVRAPRPRALSAAGTLWIAVLAIDFLVRQRVARLTADAVALISFETAAGGVGGMLRNVWTWYGASILWVVAGGAAAAWAARRLWRHRAAPTWGAIESIGTGAAVAGVGLLLTVFSPLWPETRALMTAQTVVGYPFGIAVSTLSDVDGDGSGPFDAPADTAPFDASRHPYAIDIPDDGIDQDLLAGDLEIEAIPPARRAALDALSDYPPVTFSTRRNVVVMLLESVRHDSLAAQVRGRAVTPRLRELVDGGAAAPGGFFAANGFTMVSVTHLFWGGFRNTGSTLIDDFKSNGYTVGCFSGASFEREGAGWGIGLEKADVVVDASVLPATPPFGTSRADDVAGAVEAFLAGRRDPFFVYVLFDDPHFPYLQRNPPVLCDGPLAVSQIDRDDVETLRAAYYNQVYHVDAAVGRVIDALKREGLYDETIVIAVSDHGEALFDDGVLLGHGLRLNDVMTRCLAVVSNASGDVPDLASHHHLRGWLRAWMTGMPAPADDTVLQFLGSFDRPARIAAVTAEGRLAYDFRTGGPIDEPRLRELILQWEYLRLR